MAPMTMRSLAARRPPAPNAVDATMHGAAMALAAAVRRNSRRVRWLAFGRMSSPLRFGGGLAARATPASVVEEQQFSELTLGALWSRLLGPHTEIIAGAKEIKVEFQAAAREGPAIVGRITPENVPKEPF